MSARPLLRSTITAWMFIAQSSEPMAAPNKSNVATSHGADEATANTGKVAHTNKVAVMTTDRQPIRPHRKPASGIATIEPAPKHSNRRPSVPSVSAARDFTNGTNGAQAAIPKPAIKKAIRVDVWVDGRSRSKTGLVLAIIASSTPPDTAAL